MAGTKVAKVTISLPANLLELADRIAGERSMTRSAVIVELLRREEDARIEAMLRADTSLHQENLILAEEQWPETVRMLHGIPWDESERG